MSKNLHSNMVLFKLGAEKTFNPEFKLFTFQYGSIQM